MRMSSMRNPLLLAPLFVGAVLPSLLENATIRAEPVKEKGPIVQDEIPKSQFHFDGVVGQRVQANVENWLMVAPKNNPGLLDMFALRDAGPAPDLVPWAGEFVGKYLISGVQAMRMSDDPKLKETLQGVVDRLVSLQAEDGYLGPWQKDERLRGHWDAWGHYHVMLGLMMWHEQTGGEQAFTAARRIADLACNTYLDSGFRVLDAGSHEMNMGIIHSMARIYRETGEPRYLRLAQEVLKDFERSGDYYRTGLEGKEFFLTPKPRWESLHSLQGIFELYRITGDEKFRQAFLHHWASMRRFDLRNTGGFSSGEAAKGTPYMDQAIETCCVIAWQAVMIDALRLTGDATIADDLEQTTFNAVFGSQHPSGAWCTYDTPMRGDRKASHIHIAFQIRKGTPHLNCCSVNGPRGYGMLSEWGVMRRDGGLAVNFYGPIRADVFLADSTPVTIVQRTDYPLGGKIEIEVEIDQPKQFPLRLRIPAWSTDTQAALNGKTLSNVASGKYLVLDRTWKRGDRITLDLNMNLRYEAGDLEQAQKASVYRGPILLASDSRFRDGNAPKIDVSKLAEAKPAPKDEVRKEAGEFQPWLAIDVPTVDGQTLRLIDFANAGATTLEGKPLSTYSSWLPAAGLRPPRPVAWKPTDGSRFGPGSIRFAWRGSSATPDQQHTVVISDSPSFENILLRTGKQKGSALVISSEQTAKLKPNTEYYWKVISHNENGQRESLGPHKRFTIDPSAPPQPGTGVFGERKEDQMVTAASLQGDVQPEYGTLLEAKGWKPAEGPDGSANQAIELNGQDGMVKYQLMAFPEENYSVSIWASLTSYPTSAQAQIFSACRHNLDPLRIVFTGGKLNARIEACLAAYNTEGIEMETGKWVHLVVVKQGEKLTLYADGQARATCDVPRFIISAATEFAIGGNPDFTGGAEFLATKLTDLRFYARALSGEEVEKMHEAGAGKNE